MSVKNNKDIYKIKPYDKDYLFNSNYYSVQFGKNSNYIDNKIGNKLWKYIILIQSTVRGFLLRIKLAQYLNLYERIKKAMYIIQYIDDYYLYIKSPLNKLKTEIKYTKYNSSMIKEDIIKI